MIGWRTKTPPTEADKPKGFDDFDLRLGDLMRGERATIGKSLLDIQRELKIKASYIAAIENADVSAFESPGFIAGYVRSYARYLGMNPDWAFEKFCKEANFQPMHGMSAAASAGSTASFRARRAEGEVGDPFANPNTPFAPRAEALFANLQPGAIGSMTVLAAVAGAIAFGGWTILQEVQRVQLSPVDQAPVVVTEIDPLQSTGNGAGTAADPVAEVASAAHQGTATALDRLYEPKALTVPVIDPRDGPIAAIDPATTGVLATTAPAAGQPGTVQVLADAAAPVEIVATRPAWVQVSSADGKVIFEKILDAGERYAVPALDAPPQLRSGNSGAVYFLVQGQLLGPASPGANVVKNVPLGAEMLAAAYQPADLAADPEIAKVAELLAQPAPPAASAP